MPSPVESTAARNADSFDTVAILGVGLIGGSLARALKRANAAREIVGYSRSTATLELARDLNVIDRAAQTAAAAVEGAEVVVVAVHLAATETVLAEIRTSLSEPAIVTDVGSVKAPVVGAARRALGSKFPCFVPGHPLAGTEKSGVEASFAELFERRRVILTPVSETLPEAVGAVHTLWRRAGVTDIALMTPEAHDSALAATSHLPHVLAYALVECVARDRDGEHVLRNAAGGFADITRIASSDAAMWRDICLANRGAILEGLKRFGAIASEIAEALECGDGARLQTIFAHAKQIRDGILDRRA
jgi:prephenate dehydrogenase